MVAAAFLTALFISLLATPVVIACYRRLRIVDIPDPANAKTTHDRPVPRGGGIAIFASVAIGLFLFVPLDQHLLGVLGGAMLIAIVGVLDDRFDLNPYLRLVLLFGAAGIVVASGIGLPYINVPFIGVVNLDQPRIAFEFLGQTRNIWVAADLFALLWIVGLTNFVNWSKGLDGQLPGIAAIAAMTIGLLSLRFSADITQWPVITLALVTAGAYAGFLPWNFYPQKIMPGFGGGALAGYLLAVMSLLSTTKVGTLLVVLGVPLLDAAFTIIRRLAQGRSPVWGDRGHFHHHLLDDLQWSKRRIALFYWGVSAALGVVALRLNSQQKFYTMIGVALALGGALLWLIYRGQSLKQHDPKDG